MCSIVGNCRTRHRKINGWVKYGKQYALQRAVGLQSVNQSSKWFHGHFCLHFITLAIFFGRSFYKLFPLNRINLLCYWKSCSVQIIHVLLPLRETRIRWGLWVIGTVGCRDHAWNISGMCTFSCWANAIKPDRGAILFQKDKSPG